MLLLNDGGECLDLDIMETQMEPFYNKQEISGNSSIVPHNHVNDLEYPGATCISVPANITTQVSFPATAPFVGVKVNAVDDKEFAKWVRCNVEDLQVGEAFIAELRGISRKSKAMKGTVQDIIGKLKQYDNKSPWLTGVNSGQWIQKSIGAMGHIHAGSIDESYDRMCFELVEWYPTLDPMKAFLADQKKVQGLVEKLNMAVYFLHNEDTMKKKVYTMAQEAAAKSA